MVFSGIFEGERDVVYAARTNLFYIGALYTGMGDFGIPPTQDFQSICEWFAQNSSPEEPIRITHTTNGNQTSAGALIEDTIQSYGGYTIRRGLFVDEIGDAIDRKITHIYTGDMMQIARMALVHGYPYDLDVDVLFDQNDPLKSYRYYAPFSLPNNLDK